MNKNETPPVENRRTFLLHLIRNVVSIDVILLIGTGLICFFNGWSTLSDFSSSLFIVGLVAIIFATIISARNFEQEGIDPLHHHAMTPDVPEDWRAGFILLFGASVFIAGVVAIVVSIFVGFLA